MAKKKGQAPDDDIRDEDDIEEEDIEDKSLDDEDGENEEAEIEKLRSETKRARKEAIKYRKELKSLKDDIEKGKSKKSTDEGKFKEPYERAQEKIKKLENRLQSQAENTALKLELQKQGCVDIDAAVKLIDRGTITYDPDDDTVDGVDFAVEDLMSNRKYLFGREKKRAKGTDNPNFKKKGEEGQMTREEVEALPAGDPRRREWFRKRREEKRKRGGF